MAVAEDLPEAHFSWERVRVSDDGRALTISGIHSPPIWDDPESKFVFGRAEVEYREDAVLVLLWLREADFDDPAATWTNDHEREVRVELDEPLGSRVVVDGSYRLLEAEPQGGDAEPQPWIRTHHPDDRTAVVYWHGHAVCPLERVEQDWTENVVVLTVFEACPSRVKMVGQYRATIVRLDRPVGRRRVVDGAPKPAHW